MEPFLGEIRMFAGKFAPRGNALCEGQLLPVDQNKALSGLFGNTYGGDGRITFGLPDLRGRLPIHQGKGPGPVDRRIGSCGGEEEATITVATLPAHTHQLQASAQSASVAFPGGNVTAKADIDIYNEETPGKEMSAQAITNTTGGGSPHTNLMPFLCVPFIVALFGTYPSRR